VLGSWLPLLHCVAVLGKGLVAAQGGGLLEGVGTEDGEDEVGQVVLTGAALGLHALRLAGSEAYLEVRTAR
jgi:hypothetical protein